MTSHRRNEAESPPGTAPRQPTVLWVIAILLAVIATALIMGPGGRSVLIPSAYAEGPMAGARGIYAFTGPLDKNSYGLFMMDVDARTVWVYQYLPATRKLRLAAARSFDFDRYLEDYNNDSPTLDEVRGMLDDQRRIRERREREGEGGGEHEALGITIPGVPTEGARGGDKN